MDRLGAIDQIFYKVDQYHVASVVMGGVTVLAPAHATEKLNAKTIAGHLAARLERVPMLRTQFQQDPFRLGRVHRIEDPDFDVRRHINVVSVSAPGGQKEFTQCISELAGQALDRSLLWQWVVIDGLAGGKVGIMCRLHHALADGIGASAALMAMYDQEAVEAETLPPHRPRDRNPTKRPTARLLGKALVDETLHWGLNASRFAIKNARPLSKALLEKATARRAATSPEVSPTRAEIKPTSLNARTPSNKRTLAYRSIPRVEIKRLAKDLDCTVNDIGLLLYGIALETYFAARKETVDFNLHCGVPINTRTGASAEGGNQVKFALINLHNTIPDLLNRVKAIHGDTVAIKQQNRPENAAIDIEQMANLVSPALLDALLLVEGKLGPLRKRLIRKPAFNAILSNVPGPAQPLYVANGVVVENIPMMPLVEIIGMCAGITSSADFITFSFHCFSDVVDDAELFVQGIDSGLKRLQEAIRQQNAPRKPSGSRRGKSKSVRTSAKVARQS